MYKHGRYHEDTQDTPKTVSSFVSSSKWETDADNSRIFVDRPWHTRLLCVPLENVPRPPLQLRFREKNAEQQGERTRHVGAQKSRVWQYDSRNLENEDERGPHRVDARTFKFPFESVSRTRSSRTTEGGAEKSSVAEIRLTANALLGIHWTLWWIFLDLCQTLSADRTVFFFSNRLTSRFGTGAFVLSWFLVASVCFLLLFLLLLIPLRDVLGFVVARTTAPDARRSWSPRHRDVEHRDAWPTHERREPRLPRALGRRFREGDASSWRSSGRRRRRRRQGRHQRRRWRRGQGDGGRLAWALVQVDIYTWVCVLLCTWSPSVLPIAFAGA